MIHHPKQGFFLISTRRLTSTINPRERYQFIVLLTSLLKLQALNAKLFVYQSSYVPIYPFRTIFYSLSNIELYIYNTSKFETYLIDLAGKEDPRQFSTYLSKQYSPERTIYLATKSESTFPASIYVILAINLVRIEYFINEIPF